jgi:hypothetical protein
VRLVRWALSGLLLGAFVAFVAEALRPHRDTAAGSGYQAPVASTDRRVALPG